MMEKKIHHPHAHVTKRHAPPAVCKWLAVVRLPFEICQYEPARQVNVITSVRKRVDSTIFVRTDSIRYKKQRKPMARRKKAKLEWKPTVSRPEAGLDGSVAYAPQAL